MRIHVGAGFSLKFLDVGLFYPIWNYTMQYCHIHVLECVDKKERGDHYVQIFTYYTYKATKHSTKNSIDIDVNLPVHGN